MYRPITPFLNPGVDRLHTVLIRTYRERSGIIYEPCQPQTSPFHAMETADQLTPLQLELLKAYAFEPTEEELLQVKALLGKIFADRLTARVDQAVQEKGITEDDLDHWLNDEDQ